IAMVVVHLVKIPARGRGRFPVFEVSSGEQKAFARLSDGGIENVGRAHTFADQIEPIGKTAVQLIGMRGHVRPGTFESAAAASDPVREKRENGANQVGVSEAP